MHWKSVEALAPLGGHSSAAFAFAKLVDKGRPCLAIVALVAMRLPYRTIVLALSCYTARYAGLVDEKALLQMLATLFN